MMRRGVITLALGASAAALDSTEQYGSDSLALLQQSLTNQAGDSTLESDTLTRFLGAFFERHRVEVEDLLQTLEAGGSEESSSAAVNLERKPGEVWARKIQRKLKQAEDASKAVADALKKPDRPQVKCDKDDVKLLKSSYKTLIQWKGIPQSCKYETLFTEDTIAHRQKQSTLMEYCVKDLLHVSARCSQCGADLMWGLWLGKGTASEMCKSAPSHCQGLTPDEINLPCGQTLGRCMKLGKPLFEKFFECSDMPFKPFLLRVMMAASKGFEDGWIVQQDAFKRVMKLAGSPFKAVIERNYTRHDPNYNPGARSKTVVFATPRKA